MTGGAIVGAFGMGRISDKSGRRFILCLSGLLGALTASTFLLTRTYLIDVLIAPLYGIAFGISLSVK